MKRHLPIVAIILAFSLGCFSALGQYYARRAWLDENLQRHESRWLIKTATSVECFIPGQGQMIITIIEPRDDEPATVHIQANGDKDGGRQMVLRSLQWDVARLQFRRLGEDGY